MSASPPLAILGRVPPGYGGVSVHLARLLERLRKERIEYDFYDLSGKCWPDLNIFPARASLSWLGPFLIRARRQYKLIHLHASNPQLVIAADALLAGSGVRMVHTLHGEGIYRAASQKGPWIRRWLLRRALRRADRLFAINKAVAEHLPSLGVDSMRVSWMAAYLPPTISELDPASLPEIAGNFINNHKPVVAMQAWFGAFVDGRDIYGLDQIVELVRGLVPRFPQFGICSVMSGSYSVAHREKIYAARAEAHMEGKWLILEGAGPVVSLFKQCDLFIRPTLTDGDSLSVRECLAMGIPVVASDAVPRPKGCRLYPKGNIVAMIEAVAVQLGSRDDDSLARSKPDGQDHAATLLEYYRNQE